MINFLFLLLTIVYQYHSLYWKLARGKITFAVPDILTLA